MTKSIIDALLAGFICGLFAVMFRLDIGKSEINYAVILVLFSSACAIYYYYISRERMIKIKSAVLFGFVFGIVFTVIYFSLSFFLLLGV